MSTNNTVEEAMNALTHACEIGRTDVVQSALASLRLELGSVSTIVSRQRLEDGASALHLACLNNHADVVRALLNIDCDLSVVGTKGKFDGNRPYDCCIINADSDLDEKKDNFALQAFHVFLFEAVAMNKPERVLRLLQGGVPVDILDGGETRESLLHWACSFGHTEVSKVLLEHACDANFLNAKQESPLHLACKANNAILVEMLLDEGAYSDMDQEVMLSSKPDKDIVKLLKKSAEPTFKPTFRLKAVHEQREAAHKAAIDASKVNDVFAMVEWDDERLERKAAQIPTDDAEDEDDYLSRQPLLVLWPPAQRQRRIRGSSLVLHSNSILYISIVSQDIDIYPLLTWSGLMDAFDSFGLTAHVKRTVPGSSISLCIDKNLCPKPHQYELVITEDRATLIAGDQTGLLYSIYAFIQLLQLHSEVVSVRDGKEVNLADARQSSDVNRDDIPTQVGSGNAAPYAASNGSFMNGTAISLYPLVIQDWPDISNRAVMWSHRRAARLSARIVRNMIQLLSKLRINMVHLVVDCLNSSGEDGEDTAKEGSNWANRVGTNDNVNNSENRDNTKLFAIFEVCSRHRVELIPTIVISSLYQNADVDMLRNCSCEIVNVLFLFEQRAVAADIVAAFSSSDASDLIKINGIEIRRGPITTLMILQVIREGITNILQQVQLAGFSSVSIGASAWTQRAADPLRIASNLGLAAILHLDLDVVYPVALFTKPVISAQGFIATMGACVAHARGEAGGDRTSSAGSGSLSVFPAYMDSDFMTPMLMLKYYSFLHAGFTWNSSAMFEMGLGDSESGKSSIGAGIIKEVVGLLLFPEEARMQNAQVLGAVKVQNGENSALSYDALQAVMDIFTGDVLTNELDTSATQNYGASPFSSGANTSLSSSTSSDKLSVGPTPPVSPRRSVAESANKFIAGHLNSDLVQVEQIIWSFVTARASVADALVPTKAEAALCLRYCRRALNSSKWSGGYKGNSGKSVFENVGTMFNNLASSIGTGTRSAKERGVKDNISACSADIDELFACIAVMSVVCRALVLSYNQLQKESTSESKQPASLTLTQLLHYLPLGTTSDVANSLLEAIEQCTGLWRRRFENIDFLKTSEEFALDRKISGVMVNTVEGAARTYLTFQKPSLPCRAFFEELNLQKYQKGQMDSLIEHKFMNLFFKTMNSATTEK